MAVPCVFILAGCFQNWFHFNSSRNYNNCWWIVILCILYAWHFYILDFDTKLWLCIIPFMAIPCIGIVTVQISNKKWAQNSLLLHQIDSGLSYFAFYMHRVGIYGLLIMTLGVDGTGNGSSLWPSCGVGFQNDLTLICLVLQQIDCSFSYCTYPRHGFGISVLLITNWWGWSFKLHGFLFCHGECSH
jgi:hypothetical protein